MIIQIGKDVGHLVNGFWLRQFLHCVPTLIDILLLLAVLVQQLVCIVPDIWQLIILLEHQESFDIKWRRKSRRT